LVGISLVYVLETQVLLSDLSKDLTRQATLIAEVIKSQPEVWSDADQAQRYLSGVSLYMEEHIVLVLPDGEILASSKDMSSNPDLQEIDTTLPREPSVFIMYGVRQHRVEVQIPVTGDNQEMLGIVGVTETIEAVASQFERLRWWVLIILSIELILGLVIGFVLASRLARPISRSAAAVIKIAEGKRIEPVPKEGPLEIKNLSTSINILAERLRVLEESRRRSLANIVHELGRPLGALLSAIHVLRQRPGDDPQIREELLEGMEKEINLMQPLLDDLAQLHGQVSGTFVLDRLAVEMSNWLPTILLPWRAAAIEKGLRWETEIPSNLPTINLDPKRMAQAIGNILSNAIKYTPEYGTVSVIAGSGFEDAWIQVSDTGPGIMIEEQRRVFEPFYRSQQEQRFPKGLGLGLTIARDLVTAHGGRLELNSTPGKGSSFTIYFPIENP
jgi:signal transduction histidine kinase